MSITVFRRFTALFLSLILIIGMSFGVSAFADTDPGKVNTVEEETLELLEYTDEEPEGDSAFADTDPSKIHIVEGETHELPERTIPEMKVIGEEPELKAIELPNPDLQSFSAFNETIEIPYSNLADFAKKDMLEINTLTRPRSGDFYTSVQGYLTQQGDALILSPITVFNGEVLHVELEVPNVATIDYDMILVEIDHLGNLYAVDSSEYTTFINGTHGTLREAVGVTVHGATKNFGVLFIASQGSSSTMPFIAHIGINTYNDSFEADQNTKRAIGFALPNTGGILAVGRRMDTRADNDWFRFDVPSNRPYTALRIELDNRSVTAGHTVELYTLQNNQAHRVNNIDAQSGANVSPGTYFIRVSANQRPLTGQDYEITITPIAVNPSNITFSMSGPDYSAGINYGFGNLPRIRAGNPLTINGRATRDGVPVPNAQLIVDVFNDGWYGFNATLYHQTTTIRTDSDGNFSVVMNLYSGRGLYSYYNVTSTHYFDLGHVRVYSPVTQVVSGRNVYILSHVW